MRSFAFVVLAGCLPSEERPAAWSYVHAAIIEPNCATAGCHSQLTAIAGLSLASREGAYTMLTGRVCGEPIGPETAPRNYVTPFAPEYSQLVYQLRGDSIDVMPPDVPLPASEIALVVRWIDEGAVCE